MHFRKTTAEISVMEAVDHLSQMAELDISLPEDVEKVQPLTEEQMGEKMHALSWHDREYDTYNRERVRETFRAVLKYMKDLYDKDKGQLRDEQTQRGIQAIMMLASEAAQKLDTFTDIFKGEPVAELKEFKELQHFYLTKVVQRFQTVVEPEDKWKEEWGIGEIAGETKEGIRDLETVRRDEHYELFLVRRDDGRPYFYPSLLQHMTLVGLLDGLWTQTQREDLFQRIEIIRDREYNALAKEILKTAAAHIDTYYKEAMNFKQLEFVTAMNCALMALMLAANSRNLLQTTSGKSSAKYFADFQVYLRRALTSPSERFPHLALVLCHAFFMRTLSNKDMVAFIKMLIEKGNQYNINQTPTRSPDSLWNSILDADDNIRYLFRQFPNGPLMKSVGLFAREDELSGFDPIVQQNLPAQLFTFENTEMHISCLRLAAPVRQTVLKTAEILPEFTEFLKSLQRRGRHLLINLQNRTSTEEHARCMVLEQLSSDPLTVVTLPKDTDFYTQSGTYVELNEAHLFKKQLHEQIASAEQCGFYFPGGFDALKFTDRAINAIHSLFFANKEILTHKNRLDFIEIFYLLLTLKMIEEFKPDSLSFTCKDAIDTGAAASAGLYAFLSMMNDSPIKQDFLLWMLYAPAVSARWRAIESKRLNRIVSAMTLICGELEAHRRTVVEELGSLFKLSFFKDIKIS